MTLFDLLILLIRSRTLRRSGPGHHRLFTRWVFGFYCLRFVGAVLGVWLARSLGLPELFNLQVGTTTFPIVWSIIGSALFVA